MIETLFYSFRIVVIVHLIQDVVIVSIHKMAVVMCQPQTLVVFKSAQLMIILLRSLQTIQVSIFFCDLLNTQRQDCLNWERGQYRKENRKSNRQYKNIGPLNIFGHCIIPEIVNLVTGTVCWPKFLNGLLYFLKKIEKGTPQPSMYR